MNPEGTSADASKDGYAQQQSADQGAPPNFGAPAATIVDDPLPRAPELLFANSTEDKKLYWDRSHYDSPESQMRALAKSSTLYIGNMAFSTRSYNVHSHFSQIGPVRRIVMGMDRFQKTPCGFGFVEYVHREDALLAISNLTSTKLDGRIIRVELDAGFQPGRQYGRGASGGQVRDDKRRGRIDPARNKRNKTLNWTPAEQVKQEEQQQQQQQQHQHQHQQQHQQQQHQHHQQQQQQPNHLANQPLGGNGMVGPDSTGVGGIGEGTAPQSGDADMGQQESTSRFRDE